MIFFRSPRCVAARCHVDPSTDSNTTSPSLSLSADTQIPGQIKMTTETKHGEREPNILWHEVH